MRFKPFDLTDLDWSPALWMACFDSEEQNAQAASDLWTQNAFDVATTFIQDLIPFLSAHISHPLSSLQLTCTSGHENSNVRRSCAIALSECLDTHPEHLSPLLAALKELYRVKVRIVLPGCCFHCAH